MQRSRIDSCQTNFAKFLRKYLVVCRLQHINCSITKYEITDTTNHAISKVQMSHLRHRHHHCPNKGAKSMESHSQLGPKTSILPTLLQTEISAAAAARSKPLQMTFQHQTPQLQPQPFSPVLNSHHTTPTSPCFAKKQNVQVTYLYAYHIYNFKNTSTSIFQIRKQSKL